MKVDIDHPNRANIRVFLNGVERGFVMEADDERGYIDYVVVPVVVLGGNLLAHRVFGEVRIENAHQT